MSVCMCMSMSMSVWKREWRVIWIDGVVDG
jgi:hypothetical protein